jgi:hypothetical protein
MKSFSWLIVAAAAAQVAAPAAGAEVGGKPRAVLELFTSQGCSSCPKADALLASLRAQPDLITLAYHVDYWDYIGWTDTFGSKANSDRQKAYAESWGSSRIYTPQLVVNGISGVVASREKDVGSAVATARLDVPVTLSVGGDMLEVSIAPGTGPQAMVWLVTFKDHDKVAIERGENAGQTVDYTQIVTGRQMLGMWDPATGTHLKLPLSQIMTGGANGAVILLQADKSGGLPGAILGAGSVKL